MQGMIVGGIIVLALLYVVRKARQAIAARGGGCGCGCSGCSRAPKDGSSICPSARKG